MASGFQARLPYLLLAAAVLILDRWTKGLVDSHLVLNQSISVIDGFFDITYVRNTGVAFGIFASISSPAKAMLLSLFTAAAVLFIVIYSIKSSVSNRLLQTGLALILGGALGNLYDRVTYGYVIDFVEFYVGNYHWPAFNVADSAITTGVVLLALEIIRDETRSRT